MIETLTYLGILDKNMTSQQITQRVYDNCAGEPVYYRYNTTEQVGRKFETAKFFKLIQEYLTSQINPVLTAATFNALDDIDIPVFKTGANGSNVALLQGGYTIKFAEEIGILYKNGVPYFNPLKAHRQGKGVSNLLTTQVWIANDASLVNYNGVTYKVMALDPWKLNGQRPYGRPALTPQGIFSF